MGRRSRQIWTRAIPSRSAVDGYRDAGASDCNYPDKICRGLHGRSGSTIVCESTGLSRQSQRRGAWIRVWAAGKRQSRFERCDHHDALNNGFAGINLDVEQVGMEDNGPTAADTKNFSAFVSALDTTTPPWAQPSTIYK